MKIEYRMIQMFKNVFVVQSCFYIRAQYNKSHRFFLIINYKLSTLD